MTDSEVNKKRSLKFAFLPIEGIQVIACRTWLKEAQTEAWAVAVLATAAGDNALRQTEAIPAHLSMVIGKRPHRQRGQRMGQYAGSVAIMTPERAPTAAFANLREIPIVPHFRLCSALTPRPNSHDPTTLSLSLSHPNHGSFNGIRPPGPAPCWPC